MQSLPSQIIRMLLIAPTTVPCAAYAAMGIPISLFGIFSGQPNNGLFLLLLPISIGGLFGFAGLWIAVLTRGKTIMRKNLVVSVIYAVAILGIAIVRGINPPSKDVSDLLILLGIIVSLAACIVFSIDYLAKRPN